MRANEEVKIPNGNEYSIIYLPESINDLLSVGSLSISGPLGDHALMKSSSINEILTIYTPYVMCRLWESD